MSAAPSSIAGDTIRPAKKIEHRKTMSSRRFPPPWSITELEACLVVDGAGQKLAYVYFEEEPGLRSWLLMPSASNQM